MNDVNKKKLASEAARNLANLRWSKPDAKRVWSERVRSGGDIAKKKEEKFGKDYFKEMRKGGKMKPENDGGDNLDKNV